MHVQRVAMPASRLESWTVLGDDDVPIEPVERYLAYLSDVERSPNTVRAYAYDLKDYWVFLAHRGLDWREVRLEDIGEYVAWLRLPPAGRAGAVTVLPSVEPRLGGATINRKLSALAAFYQHQARHGVDVGELLTTWQLPGRRGGWKPFLYHLAKDKPQPRRAIALKAPKKLPRVLTATETQTILDACTRLRDRFLLALLHDSGGSVRAWGCAGATCTCYRTPGFWVARWWARTCTSPIAPTPTVRWPSPGTLARSRPATRC